MLGKPSIWSGAGCLGAITVPLGVLILTSSADIGGDTTKTTLTANFLNNVNVGDSSTDALIVINYYGKRGSSYSHGEIRIINKGGASCEVLHEWDNDDLGIDTFDNPMTADISGTDIRLNITVDSSSVDNVTFNYIKTRVVL